MAAHQKADHAAAELQDELERAAVDMISATSKLDMRAAEIRNQRPNWRSYLQGGMIQQEDYNFISQFENNKGDERRSMFDKEKNQCAKTLLHLMMTISKDQTVQYLLTLIDDLLKEDRSRVDIFNSYAKENRQSVYQSFLGMLNRPDGFIVNQVSRIIAKLACWSPDLMDGQELMFYLNWLKDQLKIPGNEYVQTSARCLQMMLRIDEYRYSFVNIEGIQTIVSILSGKANFQLQYQLAFCLWCLTFNCTIAERMHRYSVIPCLADILTETHKEKVQRIILATFRNMLDKVEDRDIVRDNALQMVQCKVLKTLELLQEKKHEDSELTEDIDYLIEQLQNSVQDLSSFDEYTTEIRSGRLNWSPVHKSEKFWRENAQRFNEKNFEILKMLIKILETSPDPLVLCVASHDLGEYVRHYPRGKTIIEKLDGKQLVMRLLTHEDPNVRYHALLAIQKIMVHNWEYLGKQLESEQTQDKGKAGAKQAGGKSVPAKA